MMKLKRALKLNLSKINFTIMKPNLLIGIFVFSAMSGIAQKKCDIAAIYSGKDVSYEDVKVLTKTGSVEDAELLLMPTRISEGSYEVRVTRKGSNMYRVDNDDIYILTRYCYEYSYSEEAILVVKGQYGYDKGSIIFSRR